MIFQVRFKILTQFTSLVELLTFKNVRILQIHIRTLINYKSVSTILLLFMFYYIEWFYNFILIHVDRRPNSGRLNGLKEILNAFSNSSLRVRYYKVKCVPIFIQSNIALHDILYCVVLKRLKKNETFSSLMHYVINFCFFLFWNTSKR